MTLSEMLRKRRKELGMTTQQVADAVDKRKRSYEYYEDVKDPTSPDIYTLVKLSQVLKFDLAEVFGDAMRLHKEVKDTITENPPSEQGAENKPEKEDMATQTLFKLANANEMLAYSNKELAMMLRQEREPAEMPVEIVEAFGSTIQSLQDVVIDMALGRKFRDKEEVADALTGKAGTLVSRKAL